MIVGNICEFLDSLIKRFFRSEFIQVYALIFQCVEIALHRCVVIWVTCLAHALRHIYGFTEFDKCFRRILCSPVQNRITPSLIDGCDSNAFFSVRTARSLVIFRSVILAITRAVNKDSRIVHIIPHLIDSLKTDYVKSVHHFDSVFLQ